MNSVCMICRYNAKSDRINTMIRIDDILTRLHLDKPSEITHFNWGSTDSCKYGISTCNKQSENKRYFDQYSRELNSKLSSLIEYKNDKVYHEILNLLRGKFPNVYRELEFSYKN